MRTDPITYVYDVSGHEVAVTRVHTGTAYPVNGNVHNPTEYFLWSVRTDGRLLHTSLVTRASAYEHGRASVLGIDYFESPRPGRSRGIRHFHIVAAEMRANYRATRKGAAA